MQHLAVHWHEGLFLRPQHLQAWDRHQDETRLLGQRLRTPFGHGLASIAINPDALAAGYFQIDHVRAQLAGGTLVEWNDGQTGDRVDLRTALEQADGTPEPWVDVYLAVTRLRLGDVNVDPSENGPGNRTARSHWSESRLPDEADPASIEPILIRRLNVRVLLGGDERSGCETLRIARVRRSAAGEVVATLDARCVPPLTDLAAWPPLRRDGIGKLLDRILLKIQALAAAVTARSRRLTAASSDELEQLLLLRTLNEAAATLTHLTRTAGVHPADGYAALVRVAGSVDLFGSGRRFETVPAYDHDAIGPVFAELIERIERRIAAVGRPGFEQRFLRLENLTATAELPAHWSTAGGTFVIGIEAAEPTTPAAVTAWFRADRPGWKLGPGDRVEQMHADRDQGIELRTATSVDPSLPPTSRWVYFKIDPLNSVWREAVRGGSLGLRFPESMIDSPGAAASETIAARMPGRTSDVRIAVFRVEAGGKS